MPIAMNSDEPIFFSGGRKGGKERGVAHKSRKSVHILAPRPRGPMSREEKYFPIRGTRYIPSVLSKRNDTIIENKCDRVHIQLNKKIQTRLYL